MRQVYEYVSYSPVFFFYFRPWCGGGLGDASIMTDKEIEWATHCAETVPLRFYESAAWHRVRNAVLLMDRYECQNCRNKHHQYRKATTVHHVNYFKNRPDLALEVWYTDTATGERKRNLISLCHECHDEVHNWRRGEGTEPLTEERWD